MDKLLKYILLGLTGASLVLVALLGLLGILALGICAFLLYRHLQKTDGEYEYVHTNDVFDVDLVICNRSRKQRCTVNLNQVILVAPIDSEDAASYEHLPATDYSGNAGENLYAMIYTKDGKQRKLLLKLENAMHRSLKHWIPGKVQ